MQHVLLPSGWEEPCRLIRRFHKIRNCTITPVRNNLPSSLIAGQVVSMQPPFCFIIRDQFLYSLNTSLVLDVEESGYNIARRL